jgi:hypothetical protein
VIADTQLAVEVNPGSKVNMPVLLAKTAPSRAFGPRTG